jgi:hypothetical protein
MDIEALLRNRAEQLAEAKITEGGIEDITPAPVVEKTYGSLERYQDRLKAFRDDLQPYPRLRHQVLWLVHNCIAHPILAVYPKIAAVEFHDLTSQWLNQTPVTTVMRPPTSRKAHDYNGIHTRKIFAMMPWVDNKRAWFFHNAVVHPLIGLLPCKWTFAYHDRTAEKMKVHGWV